MMNIVPKVKCLEEVGSKIHFQKVMFFGDLSASLKAELEVFVFCSTHYDYVNGGYEIVFEKSKQDMGAEQYSIVIEQNKMTITAGCDEGLYRAAQTLKQILLQDIYECRIEDEPANSFRGFMLDVGRYFYPVDDVKRIIDSIALFKFNCLHLHLTEDQGWRFESKKYPRLAEIGSKRSHTNFNCKSEGGYYTREQLKEIVEYCHSKFIKVIPEVDMPGHTMSALAAYPQLSCFDRRLKVATHWGVKFDIMCAGKQFTYEFCRDIIDELCEIFTDEYIHIGGDEVPKKRWELCDNCTQKMKQLGLSNMDDLQIYFANEMDKYIRSKGKRTIMWDIKSKNCKISPSPDIILQFWGQRTDTEFADTIKGGRNAITSNSSAYYIDLPYGRVSLRQSYCTQGVTGLSQTELLHGYECCLWTEYTKNLKVANRRMFPRVLAISEIYWSGENARDYAAFEAKLPFCRQYLSSFGIIMCPKREYNPNKLRAFFSRLWFEKRQLTWQGIYLNVDNFLLRKRVLRSRARAKNTEKSQAKNIN